MMVSLYAPYQRSASITQCKYCSWRGAKVSVKITLTVYEGLIESEQRHPALSGQRHHDRVRTGASHQPPLTNLDAAAGESHGDYGSLVLLLIA